MRTLVIQTGKHKGKKLRLPDRFDRLLVGRAKDCHIRLNHPDVAERHCRLSGRGAELVVEDLGSGLGTFVNDEPVRGPRVLKAGDVLRVGPLSFLVEKAAAADAAKSGTGRSAAHPVDEDAIVDWLLGEEPPASAAAAPPPAPAAAAVVPKPKKRFASVAEEAADIIRRWNELQAAKQRGGEPSQDESQSERPG